MKQIEYIEGPTAKQNFEKGMRALFKVSKGEVVRAEKKQAKKRAAARAAKQQNPDKD
ncbi:MAG TPA: hypothetical protein VGS10_04300 [Terracidiphilus sp.]|nr:hypothetical protein [Terracidiphilus sp.]